MASDAVSNEGARVFVEEAYRKLGKGESIDHPLAAARLLHDDGQPRSLELAGLLHDVLEDTDVSRDELMTRFGPEVTRLVEALTEDPAIPAYDERKAALRRQILDAGCDAATVALADKTAKLAARRSPPQLRKLKHYRATLEGIENRYGESRLSEMLRNQLDRFKT
jgi:(p)ppGpp synthase/HD superfamily hydrolase